MQACEAPPSGRPCGRALPTGRTPLQLAVPAESLQQFGPTEHDGVTASLWNVTLFSLVTSNTVLLPPLQCIPGQFYPARIRGTQRNFRVKVKV